MHWLTLQCSCRSLESTVEDIQCRRCSPASAVEDITGGTVLFTLLKTFRTLVVVSTVMCLLSKTCSGSIVVLCLLLKMLTVAVIVLCLLWKTFTVNSRRPVCVYRRRLSVQVLYLCLLWLETVSVQYRMVGSASCSQGRRPDSQMLGILNVNVKYLLLLAIPPLNLTSSPLPLSGPR